MVLGLIVDCPGVLWRWTKGSGGAFWCKVTCWLGEVANYQQSVYVLGSGSKIFESLPVFVQVVM